MQEISNFGLRSQTEAEPIDLLYNNFHGIHWWLKNVESIPLDDLLAGFQRIIARWWVQTLFIFTPKLREDSVCHFDSIFFKIGWIHQHYLNLFRKMSLFWFILFNWFSHDMWHMARFREKKSSHGCAPEPFGSAASIASVLAMHHDSPFSLREMRSQKKPTKIDSESIIHNMFVPYFSSNK